MASNDSFRIYSYLYYNALTFEDIDAVIDMDFVQNAQIRGEIHITNNLGEEDVQKFYTDFAGDIAAYLLSDLVSM